MIKYIVIWVIASYTMMTPEPPKPDKFGIYPNSSMVLSVARYKVDKDTLTKYFDNKAQAEKFYEEAKNKIISDNFTFQSGIISVGISEIKFDISK